MLHGGSPSTWRRGNSMWRGVGMVFIRRARGSPRAWHPRRRPGHRLRLAGAGSLSKLAQGPNCQPPRRCGTLTLQWCHDLVSGCGSGTNNHRSQAGLVASALQLMAVYPLWTPLCRRHWVPVPLDQRGPEERPVACMLRGVLRPARRCAGALHRQLLDVLVGCAGAI